MTAPEDRGDADVSVPARAMADPGRARMLTALLGGVRRPSGELARVAGLAPSTASEHLRVLVDAGLVVADPTGRHRYYRLAGPDVAHALEALQAVAPLSPVRSLREDRVARQLQVGRTCYDHLAGELGLRVTDLVVRCGAVTAPEVGAHHPAPEPFPANAVVHALGLDPDVPTRRPWSRGCLDWTGRRPHLAGHAGAVVLDSLRRHGWVRPTGTDRAVLLTDDGDAALAALEAGTG